MDEKVLIIDDDELLLESYPRTLRRHIRFDTARGGTEALEKLKAGERYAVILSDLRMPGMNGLEVLRQARELSPDSIRIILTGNADLRTAIDAVNEGNIFRFLEKPCSGEALISVLTAGIHQYRLVISERDLLEKTLHGTIKVLTQVLELINPEASSAASRITTYTRHLVSSLGLKDVWQFEVAAMLSQLGSSVLPHEPRVARHHELAYDMLRKIPRLETVAAMIRRQQESFRSQPQKPLAERDTETLGAQILKVCTSFEAFVRDGMSFGEAVEALQGAPGEYDPLFVDAFQKFAVAILPYEPRTVTIKELGLRMVLNEEVRSTNGALLVGRGVEVTEMLLARLRSFHERRALGETFHVLVPVYGVKRLSDHSRQLQDLVH
jgi:response regulator RpfG family c-di-GMP phosphodiesterase